MTKKTSDKSDPRSSPSAVVLLRQAAAHLLFILWGSRLWCRWAFGMVLHGGRFCTEREREDLLCGVRRYLRMLRRWGILETEFTGFKDAHSWRGTLVVANHPTILDALLIMTMVPSLEFLINARLLNHPVVGGGMRLSGFLRNDAPLVMIRSGVKALATGSNLLVFPEGTRTTKAPLGPFYPGHALVASRSGSRINTIFISCDSGYFGRDFSYFKPAPTPVRYRIGVGKAFEVSKGQNPQSLSTEIEGYMRKVLHGEGHHTA